MVYILIQFTVGIGKDIWAYVRDIWEIKSTELEVGLNVGNEKEETLRMPPRFSICRNIWV